MSEIRCWNVYSIKQTNDHHKKMFIALFSKVVKRFGQSVTVWAGFYINTNSQGMDANQVCDVKIDAYTHRFLEYDSLTNVALIVEHEAGELKERVGIIHSRTCERILDGIEQCGLLERNVEVKIIEAFKVSKSPTGP